MPIIKQLPSNKVFSRIPVEKKPYTHKPSGTTALAAFKCSKCEYIATDRKDFKEHWALEH